jgi:hypothetical protein
MSSKRSELFTEDERYLITDALRVVIAEIPLDETDLGIAEKLIKELENE